LKCPLMVTYRLTSSRGEEFVVGNCIRRECAAWDPELKFCRQFGESPSIKPTDPLMTTAFLKTILDLISKGDTDEAIRMLTRQVRQLALSARR